MAQEMLRQEIRLSVPETIREVHFTYGTSQVSSTKKPGRLRVLSRPYGKVGNRNPDKVEMDVILEILMLFTGQPIDRGLASETTASPTSGRERLVIGSEDMSGRLIGLLDRLDHDLLHTQLVLMQWETAVRRGRESGEEWKMAFWFWQVLTYLGGGARQEVGQALESDVREYLLAFCRQHYFPRSTLEHTALEMSRVMGRLSDENSVRVRYILEKFQLLNPLTAELTDRMDRMSRIDLVRSRSTELMAEEWRHTVHDLVLDRQEGGPCGFLERLVRQAVFAYLEI